ncbi:TPA: hypothetical protein ACMDXH_000738 [Vibrio parahaemolyticus]|nr:hypothetical protein [Vibrio parahaemolyticus]EHY8553042.1 hypothetical protein [Vibrio parahaemolyticus]EIA9327221.1 hypothetical protein [Vibrio parahaemolyticus]EJV9414065.1 hypothetical protein [Vibrio vulnificus]
MGFITNIKNKVRGNTTPSNFGSVSETDPELRSALDKILQQSPYSNNYQSQRPNRVQFDDGCDGYYSSGNWWDDDNDMSHEEYKEEAFDQYAREYHSAESDEERYALFNQDRSWMMN